MLLIALGPVQEFIAQARRTRDLWFGSHLLSELSRAVARALVEEPREDGDERRKDDPWIAREPAITLVFPALAAGDPELRPCDAPVREDGAAPLGVPNHIFAVVPRGVEPDELAAAARAAVFARLRSFADDVRRRCRTLIAPGSGDVWKEQVDGFLEFQAMWVALGDEPGVYRDSRSKLASALAARKSLRDFMPYRESRGAVPKSSLDGGRETVLAEQRPPEHVRRYRLGDGEQLDAIGLIKRAGGKPEQFVPIANIALAQWIERANEAAPAAMAKLRSACREVGLSRVERREFPWVEAFPLDAQVFLPARWPSLLEEAGYAGDPRSWGRKRVRRTVLDARGEPHPYVACLAADGDRMGERLRAMESPAEHRAFSARLSTFAQSARRIVERDHRGVLIYAGGDDVLAFLCLTDAVPCARRLRDEFFSLLAADRPEDEDRPTLSIGIGVGHLRDSLGHLVQLGRRAEQIAKSGSESERERNALAVLVDKRAGGELTWRARWDAEPEPAGRLAPDVALLRGPLSRSKVYEITGDVGRTPLPDELGTGGEERAWSELLELDVARTLARADTGAPIAPAEAGLTFLPESYAARRARVLSWTSRMLVARELLAAETAATPRPSRRQESG